MRLSDSLVIEPKKILIIRLSAIGDVVRMLPALSVLRRQHPSTYIAWVVEESAQDLLQGHPDLDRLYVFRRKRLRQGFSGIKNFFSACGELSNFLREIRAARFDAVLDFHGILKSGIISRLSGAPVRVGWSRAFSKECNYLFNNYHLQLESDAVSRIERNLSFIRLLGIPALEYTPVIPISSDDRQYIERFFSDTGLGHRTPLIAVHPGTSPQTLYKRWDLSSYAVLADRLIEESGATIVWTWGPGELEMVEAIRRSMTHPSTIACATAHLRQLAELYRRCDLFVGSDSGPMHIASFVHTPVVALFGPTDPIVNAPYEKNPHLVLRKDLPCSPCRERSCAQVECMRMISPDEVYTAILTLLRERHILTGKQAQ